MNEAAERIEQGQDTYSVAVYATTIVRIDGIPASVGSAKAAARYVDDHAVLANVLDRVGPFQAGAVEAVHTQFADEVLGYLVDAPNDPEFRHTEKFGSDGEGPMIDSVLQAEDIVRGLAEMATLSEGRQLDREALDGLIAKARVALGDTSADTSTAEA